MRNRLFDALLVAAFTVLVAAGVAAQHQHPPAGGAHRHPAAAKLKNPVPVNAASIAAGQKVYEKQCAGCHGDTGKGDGAMGEELNPKPSNLADADWKHGSSDGEIYTLIANGIKGSPMKAYKSKLTQRQIWEVVNYLRSLEPKTH